MMKTTWTPEPQTATVDPFAPLHASWTEDTDAVFEASLPRFGRAPRSFFVNGADAVALHAQGYTITRVR